MKVKYSIDRGSLRDVSTFKKASKLSEDSKLTKETMKVVAKIICKTA